MNEQTVRYKLTEVETWFKEVLTGYLPMDLPESWQERHDQIPVTVWEIRGLGKLLAELRRCLEEPPNVHSQSTSERG